MNILEFSSDQALWFSQYELLDEIMDFGHEDGVESVPAFGWRRFPSLESFADPFPGLHIMANLDKVILPCMVEHSIKWWTCLYVYLASNSLPFYLSQKKKKKFLLLILSRRSSFLKYISDTALISVILKFVFAFIFSGDAECFAHGSSAQCCNCTRQFSLLLLPSLLN